MSGELVKGNAVIAPLNRSGSVLKKSELKELKLLERELCKPGLSEEDQDAIVKRVRDDCKVELGGGDCLLDFSGKIYTEADKQRVRDWYEKEINGQVDSP